MIVPGTRDAACRDSGEWVFVDMGFAQLRRSCGIAIGDSDPCNITYGGLTRQIVSMLETGSSPLNLLIEAPLSVAFNTDGNPTGRKIEVRSGERPRYWYLQAGAPMLLATTHLLRRLYDLNSVREVRLFEGFASFKSKQPRSSHTDDVSRLRSVAWGGSERGSIVDREALKIRNDDILLSAFAVSGMDFGVPVVVVVDDGTTE